MSRLPNTSWRQRVRAGWQALRRRAVAYLGAAALAGLVGLVAWDLQQPPPSLSGNSGAGAGPSTQFHGTQIVARRDGQPLWSLTATTLTQQGDEVVIDGVRDGVLYREGKPYATLQATRADWQRSDGKVTFTGGVEVSYHDGTRLEAKTLVWEAQAGKLVSPAPVTLRQGNRTLVGDSMVADTQAETVDLQGNVELREAGGFVLRTARLLYHLDTQRADVFGHLGGEIPLT